MSVRSPFLDETIGVRVTGSRLRPSPSFSRSRMPACGGVVQEGSLGSG
jgi:hypothetical protein